MNFVNMCPFHPPITEYICCQIFAGPSDTKHLSNFVQNGSPKGQFVRFSTLI